MWCKRFAPFPNYICKRNRTASGWHGASGVKPARNSASVPSVQRFRLTAADRRIFSRTLQAPAEKREFAANGWFLRENTCFQSKTMWIFPNVTYRTDYVTWRGAGATWLTAAPHDADGESHAQGTAPHDFCA